MSVPTIHLKGHELNPNLPLALQASSLAAEIDATHVFQTAARRDLDAGDVQALARVEALDDHERRLRKALQQIEVGEQPL